MTSEDDIKGLVSLKFLVHGVHCKLKAKTICLGSRVFILGTLVARESSSSKHNFDKWTIIRLPASSSTCMWVQPAPLIY
jgi:hypothetical protein